jgi:hypothetical protein
LSWVARTRASFYVIPPHVLGPLAIRPQVFTGYRAGVAANTLIQMKEHAHMGANVHA